MLIKQIKKLFFSFWFFLLTLPRFVGAHGDVVDEHPEEELMAIQTVTQNTAGQKLGLALVSLVLIAVLSWLVRKFINKRDTNLRMKRE